MNKNENLGKKATDIVTGFGGIVTGYCQYLTGCSQYLIQPSTEDVNKYPEAVWIDEGKLKITSDDALITPEDILGDEDGCDAPQPHK